MSFGDFEEKEEIYWQGKYVQSGAFSVPDTAPSDFALLYYTLVKGDVLPIGYLQDSSSLEVPARRAAKRSQVSTASISDSMASTALFEFRKKG